MDESYVSATRLRKKNKVLTEVSPTCPVKLRFPTHALMEVSAQPKTSQHAS